MPTFTNRTVNVTSHTLSTTLTLSQLASALDARRPGANRTSGWGAVDDPATRLERDGAVGSLPPSVQPAAGYIPERLTARYFSWRYEPVNDAAGQAANNNWILDAVDIEVSAHGVNTYLVLYSALHADLVDVTTGRLTASLRNAVVATDASAQLRDDSFLAFSSSDVFLWLAHRAEARTPIGGSVRVDSMARVDAEEDARQFRRSTLSGVVDMQRITFLNAIAQASPLGPAVVTITEPNANGLLDRFEARLWRQGAFSLLMTNTIVRDTPDGDAARLEAVHRWAYSYIPLINRAYAADQRWGTQQRDALVISKRVELESYYQTLAQAHPRWSEWVAGTLRV